MIEQLPNAYSDPNILAEFIAGQLKNRKAAKIQQPTYLQDELSRKHVYRPSRFFISSLSVSNCFFAH
jgi:hypothetical protein